MHNKNINPIKAFVMATILGKCITFTINPNELRDLETGNLIDLNKLIEKATNQLTKKATHYLAFYINRDEPTLAIEHACSRQELIDLYNDNALEGNQLDGITSIDTFVSTPMNKVFTLSPADLSQIIFLY